MTFNAQSKLQYLRRELEFLNSGGYRQKLGWRAPLIFEDSPICPKPRFSSCPDATCVLIDFVPPEHRREAVLCRHIRLNGAGETLDTLYATATMEEVEAAVRDWLERQINQLEKAAEAQVLAIDRRPPVSMILKPAARD